ncbi:sel1 repeat family protein [Amylibacter sp.]|nr:sel1 repeat family protein [Amylibacter sp.]
MKDKNIRKIITTLIFVLLNYSTPAWSGIIDCSLTYTRGDRILCEYAKLVDAGDNVPAFKMIKSLAEKGNEKAEYFLGQMYERGLGTEKNQRKAAKWYKRSADQGLANAQYKVGYLYLDGPAVLKNYSEAAKWFKLSAAQGFVQSQRVLGALYQEGIGVIRDKLLAHTWYNIASSNGSKLAKHLRDELEVELTPEDISKATAMARECMASDYKKCGY